MGIRQAKLVRGLSTNGLFFVPYLYLGAAGPEAAGIVAIPCLVWGFLAFRWAKQHLFGEGFFHVSVSFLQFALIHVVGTVLFALLGVVILPILILRQLLELAASKLFH